MVIAAVAVLSRLTGRQLTRPFRAVFDKGACVMGLESNETDTEVGLLEGTRDRREFLVGASGALTAAFVGMGLTTAGCGGELQDDLGETQGALSTLTYSATFNVPRSKVAALASNLAAIPFWMPIITS